MDRYICIHGHFYQPPRENAWLEEVELQDSAFPYHDWNQRITAECYGANTASRILNVDRKIIDIVNNYAYMSFNFGPTLLSWIQRNEPDVYTGIIDADHRSRASFSGHGAALAQCYNHIIMPLANSRDKRTQVIWGIEDFRYRFEREPEGMWLAETAVDIETLEIMAEQGIRFTILAPHQAKRFRPIGDHNWIDLNDSYKIDPRRAYRCNLSSGRSIALFFYDGPIAQDLAFSKLLDNGEALAGRLMDAFDTNPEEPQLTHIATDGETYGHHHKHGDMALAYCLHHIKSNNLARLTIYAEFLDKEPPRYEAEIIEKSSWSCIHGIERWRSNCGCNSGMKGGWHQMWRAPLRAALDWLRDNLIEIFEHKSRGLLTDPWAARDRYIDIVLRRCDEAIEQFIQRCAARQLSDEEKSAVLKLCEMQRNAMLMYTSCGWFFDEVTGIETVQVMQYAARAIQLAHDVSGMELEKSFITLLKRAPSNIKEFGDAAYAYEKFVKPVALDLIRVGAHYAVSSIFTDYGKCVDLYSYRAEKLQYLRLRSGKQSLAVGVVKVHSKITGDAKTTAFALLHLGDHNFIGGGGEYSDIVKFDQLKQQIHEAFSRSDIAACVVLIDRFFNQRNYSLWHLFKDEQRKILDIILASRLSDAEASFRQLNQYNYSLLHAMREMHVPLPRLLQMSVEIAINQDLMRLVNEEPTDLVQLRGTIEEVEKWSVAVDRLRLEYAVSQKVNTYVERLADDTDNIAILDTTGSFLEVLSPLKLNLDLWKAENTFFAISKTVYNQKSTLAQNGDEIAGKWLTLFTTLGQYLDVRFER